MPNQDGDFIWYELLTENSDEALQFYSAILGWKSTDSGFPETDYRILHALDEDSGQWHDVGGLLQLTGEMKKNGARPVWLGYISVNDVGQTLARIVSAGGQVRLPPTDIPNVGCIAMVTDPQGAAFYIMRALGNDTSLAFASDKPRIGHCAWNELITANPEAAKAFYFKQFGWTKEDEMDLGPMGKYEFIRHNGVIGAIMPKPEDMPISMWQYYFRCADIDNALNAITTQGGQVLYGPAEIPGGDYIIKGFDPQGALFAVVGARRS